MSTHDWGSDLWGTDVIICILQVSRPRSGDDRQGFSLGWVWSHTLTMPLVFSVCNFLFWNIFGGSVNRTVFNNEEVNVQRDVLAETWVQSTISLIPYWVLKTHPTVGPGQTHKLEWEGRQTSRAQSLSPRKQSSWKCVGIVCKEGTVVWDEAPSPTQSCD